MRSLTNTHDRSAVSVGGSVVARDQVVSLKNEFTVVCKIIAVVPEGTTQDTSSIVDFNDGKQSVLDAPRRFGCF